MRSLIATVFALLKLHLLLPDGQSRFHHAGIRPRFDANVVFEISLNRLGIGRCPGNFLFGGFFFIFYFFNDVIHALLFLFFDDVGHLDAPFSEIFSNLF